MIQLYFLDFILKQLIPWDVNNPGLIRGGISENRIVPSPSEKFKMDLDSAHLLGF